jgi:hypothetical protein
MNTTFHMRLLEAKVASITPSTHLAAQIRQVSKCSQPPEHGLYLNRAVFLSQRSDGVRRALDTATITDCALHASPLPIALFTFCPSPTAHTKCLSCFQVTSKLLDLTKMSSLPPQWSIMDESRAVVR